MLEYEKKIILTADEYNTIVTMMCKDILSEIQINYYFDTDDLSMNQKGITYRIRLKNGVYTTVVKNHNTKPQDCSFEDKISVKTEFDTKYFEKLNLKLQGELITERTVLYKDSFCEMVIDRNIYLGYTDFELEIEYTKGFEQKARAFLSDIARALVAAKLLFNPAEFLNRDGQGKSKSQRFFERRYKTSLNI